DVATNMARRYTWPRLRTLLLDAGFNVTRWSYWNMSLLPAIAVARWLSRGKTSEPVVRSDLKPMSPLINVPLTALTKLELAIAKRVSLPFGTSIFAVARK
ncbi:MAG TPA: hypothetical protein VF551_06210, partial [Chthoniobacterales bacterium]